MSAHGEEMLALARQLWGESNLVHSTRRDVRFGRNGSKSVKPDEAVFFDHEAGTGGGYRDIFKLVHGKYPENGASNGQDTADGFFIPKAMSRELGLPTGQWDYHDERRRIVARVLRFEPPAKDDPSEPSGKTFRQCRPDGNRWKWSTRGIEIPLYRLPDLLAAPADALVYIVEGERKADALATWNLVATTSIMGAGKFRPHNAKTLAGRRCIVLPDNDNAGRAHAQIIVRELRKVGAVPFVLALPDLEVKGDIINWIAAGHTRDELLELVAKAQTAPEVEPECEPQPEISETEIEEAIKRLARKSGIALELGKRSEAKRLKIPVTLIAHLLKLQRSDNSADTKGQGRPLDLSAPEPWPEPVDGVTLCEELRSFFDRYALLPEHGTIALTPWAIHSHAYDIWRYTPRLHITAPSRRSGKTRVLNLLKLVVAKPLKTETVTPPALFRTIELGHPTLLLDECNALLADNAELVSMLNAGFERGGTAVRTVGDEHEPRQFDVFSPVAMAGIGPLAGTLSDRSLQMPMRRARRNERRPKITAETEAEGEQLSRKIARWVADHRADLQAAQPDVSHLPDRIDDRWFPLFAIAAVVGGDWPALVRDAAFGLTPDEDDSASLGERLLADIKAIFDAACPVTELSTQDIVDRLVLMDNRPWPEMGRSHKPLTTTRFTQMVAKFGVQRRRAYDPATQKPGAWGFRLTDFDEAFGRYLDA